MILLEDSRTLDDCLCEGFDKPLLHRASLCCNSLSGRKLSLDKFWTSLREQPGDIIDVYDYSMMEPSLRTRRKPSGKLLYWELPAHELYAINLLDIENRSGKFCLTKTIKDDLY